MDTYHQDLAEGVAKALAVQNGSDPDRAVRNLRQLGEAATRPNLTRALEDLLEQEPELMDGVARAVVGYAMAGKVGFAQLLFERIDGPVSNVTVQTSIGKAIVMIPPENAEELMPAPRNVEVEDGGE